MIEEVDTSKVDQLVAMGFDGSQAEEMLDLVDGNVEGAAMLLSGGGAAEAPRPEAAGPSLALVRRTSFGEVDQLRGFLDRAYLGRFHVPVRVARPPDEVFHRRFGIFIATFLSNAVHVPLTALNGA